MDRVNALIEERGKLRKNLQSIQDFMGGSPHPDDGARIAEIEARLEEIQTELDEIAEKAT